MLETEKIILEDLRDRRPFRVPEGYFEGFTDDFMSRLPKKTAPEAKVISLYDRVKPWLYLAATFAGIIILFNIFNKSSEIAKDENTVLTAINVNMEEEVDEEEFLEFITDLYASYSVHSYGDYLFDN